MGMLGSWFRPRTSHGVEGQPRSSRPHLMSEAAPTPLLLAMALEPRFMFDAAAAATVAEATQADSGADASASTADSDAGGGSVSHDAIEAAAAALIQNAAPAPADAGSADTPADGATTAVGAAPSTDTAPAADTSASDTSAAGTDATKVTDAPVVLRTADPTQDGGKTEVVFIESNVADWQTLTDGVKPGVEVVLLDASQDGLSQIAEWAKTHSGYDAIHIISHGDDGTLFLGTSAINQAGLAARQSELATIGGALTADGDLLLYGCDVGKGADGLALVQALASKTGADVAASADATGAEAFAGNWELESQVGQIDAALAIDSRVNEGWSHLLTATTLSAGDIAVIGMNSDGTAKQNTWSFVVLKDIGSGTSIIFTDASYDDSLSGNKFYVNSANEGYMTWTVGSDISAGAVFIVTNNSGSTATIRDISSNSQTSVSGSLGGSSFDFTSTGDQIFVYQGTSGTTVGATFIYGLNTGQSATNYASDGVWTTTGAVSSQNVSYRPAGLTDGTSAAVLTSPSTSGSGTSGSGAVYGFDNMKYNGITSGTVAQLRAAIGNAANWVGDNSITYNFSAFPNFTITAPDITPPTFDLGPSADSVTTSGFTPSASLDEAGTVYYVVVADGATAPTPAEVKAGSNYGAVTVLASGSVSATTGNFDSSFSAVSSLASGTAYDVYFVASDTSGNDQASVTRVDATTATVNAAPVIADLSGDTLTYTVGSGAVIIDQGTAATVTDADSADFSGGLLTVTGVGTGDLIQIRNQGTAAGQIGVSGSTVTYGGTAIGTLSGGLAANLKVTFNANATAAAVTALLQNLTYGNDAVQAPETRTLSIAVSDGDGGTSTTAQVTVTVAPADTAGSSLLVKIGGTQQSLGTGTLGGYNATTDLGATAVVDPNPYGLDGLTSTFRSADEFFMYQGKAYGLFVNPASALGYQFGRYDGTQVEYFGSQKFDSLNQYTFGNGKIYFSAILSENGGTKLMEFDVANSTLTTITNVDNSSALQYYDGSVYFFENTNYTVSRWDGSSVQQVFAAHGNSATFTDRMVVLNGELYFGAESPTADPAPLKYFKELFKYNSSTDTVTQLSNRDSSVNFHEEEMPSLLTAYSGKVFYAGANPGTPQSTDDLNSRWLISYDPDNDNFTTEYSTGATGRVTGIWTIDGTLYFKATISGTTYTNLYKYNGTNDVTDLTGFTSGSVGVVDVASYDGDVYLTIYDPGNTETGLYKVAGSSVTKVASFPSLATSGDVVEDFEPGLAVINTQLAPVVTNTRDLVGILAGGSTAVAANLTVTDIDSASLTGATVTVSSGKSSGDSLSFTGAHGITGSYDSGTGVLTLSGTASAADYQGVLRSVSFTAGTSAGQREFRFDVTDSDNNHTWSASPVGYAYVAVTATNGNVQLVSFDSDPTTGGMVGAVDIANANLINLQITADTDSSSYGLSYNGGLQALYVNTDGTNPAEFVIKSSNGAEFDLQGLRFKDDYNLSTVDLVFTGYRDSSQVIQATMTVAAGELSTVILPAGFNNVDEVHIAAGPGTNSMIGSTAPVGIVDDILVLSAPPQAAPVISDLDGDTHAWPGTGTTVFLDAFSGSTGIATVSDAENDGGDWNGATLTIARSATAGTASGAWSADVFGFNSIYFSATGTTTGTLSDGGTQFATYTNSGGTLTITFDSNATTARVGSVFSGITYQNDTPAGDATIRFALTDGDGGSTHADVTVTSDTIYVTDATDTATIDATNGVSFSEAIAIAAADATGSQTLVFAGSLASQTVSASAATNLNESLTLDLSQADGVTLSGGSLSIQSGFTLTATTDSGHTATIATSLSGSGGLTKAGAGTLILSGANGFADATTVSAGTLVVTGSLGSTSGVSVAQGATLGGTGSIFYSGSSNTATINGTLSPGTGSGGFGTLTINGNLAFGATGVLAADIGGTTAGTSYDQVVVKGTVTVTGGAGLTLAGSHVPAKSATGESFVLIDNDASDAISGTFSSLASGGTVTFNGVVLTASYGAGSGGNDFALTGPLNQAPSLGGTFTTAGTVNDNATTSPFSGVTVTDADDSSGSFTLTITYTAANGTLTSSGGGLAGTAGNYTLSANSPSQLQTLLQALQFSPTANQVTPGNTVVTTFTLTPSDGTTAGTADNSTQVTATSINDAPSNLALSNTTVSIFDGTDATVGGLSATDPDTGQTLTYTLVSGSGDTDNGLFNISGTSLRASNAGTLTGGQSYSVRVQVSDGIGTEEQTFTITASNDLIVDVLAIDSNAVSGSYATDKADGGGLDLKEALYFANTLSGPVTLRFAETLNGTITLLASLTVRDGITFAMDSDTDSRAITITGGGFALGGTLTVDVSSGDTLTVSSAIANDGGSTGILSKTGAGTLILAGTNSFSGGTTIAAGTVSIDAANRLGTGTLTLSGGTLDVTGSSSVTLSQAVAITADSTVAVDLTGSAVLTLSGTLSGSDANVTLTKSGDGVLKLSGTTNQTNYAGQIKISAGTLSVAKGTNLGAGRVTVDNATLFLSNASTFTNDIELIGDVTVAGALAGCGKS